MIYQCQYIGLLESPRFTTYVLKELVFVRASIGHRLIHDGTRTCTLTRNRHTRRITSKLADMLLHPLQGEVHVKKTCIERAIFFDVNAWQESKGAKSVLDDD